MKRFAGFSLFLFLSCSIAAAQASPRDVLIERCETAYLRATTLSADSPLVDMLLASTKSANREVNDDTWRVIRQEIATAVTQSLTERGSMLDTTFRKSMESLSDAELARLSQVLNDPAYTKFQSAMASPATQKQFMQAMYGDAAKFQTVANKILARHGLKEGP